MSRTPDPRLARARMLNMLSGADLQATAPAAPAPNLLDALRYPGQQAAAYLTNGYRQLQQGVQDTINQTPALSRIKRFFGDFGSGLSNGAAQSTNIPVAIQAVRNFQGQR